MSVRDITAPKWTPDNWPCEEWTWDTYVPVWGPNEWKRYYEIHAEDEYQRAVFLAEAKLKREKEWLERSKTQ